MGFFTFNIWKRGRRVRMNGKTYVFTGMTHGNSSKLINEKKPSDFLYVNYLNVRGMYKKGRDIGKVEERKVKSLEKVV